MTVGFKRRFLLVGPLSAAAALTASLLGLNPALGQTNATAARAATDASSPADSSAASGDFEAAQLRRETVEAYRAGDYARAATASAQLLDLIKQRGDNHSANYATLLVDHAGILRNLGRASEAEPLDRESLALRTKLLGEKNADTITSISNLAVDLNALGRAAEAEPLNRRALALNTALLGERDPATLISLSNLAFDLRTEGKIAQAEPLDRHALALSTEVLGERHPDTIIDIGNLAGDLRGLGRLADAELLDRRGLKLAEEVLGERHPTTLSFLSNLASDLNALGHSTEAEQLDRRALLVATEMLGDQHPDTIIDINNLANDLRSLGRVGEATELDSRALTLATRTLGANHPVTLVVVNNLAGDMHRGGFPAEAEHLDRRLLEIRTAVLGEMHPDTLVSLGNLAADLAVLGRPAEAEPLDRRALAANIELFGEKHPASINAVSNLATDLLGEGRPVEAEPLARRAVALSAAVLGESHSDTLKSDANLAVILLAQPDRAAVAIAPARRAVTGIRVMRQRLGENARGEAQRARNTLSQSDYFGLFADAAWSAALGNPSRLSSLRDEAFTALQDAMAGTTNRAVTLAAARRMADSSGSDFGSLAVERQSLSEQWIANDQAITRTYGKGGAEAAADRRVFEATGRGIESRQEAIDSRLRKEAPAYFAIIRQEALTPRQAQALLKPDEAVLIITPTLNGTHVVAVTREALSWARADLTSARVRDMVTGLRAGLDPTADNGTGSQDGQSRGYDRATAYALYRALIVPSLPVLRGKTRLFVAADGALASLPFGVLVTREPQGKDDDLMALRATRWFEDDFALIQLPSLQSLYFLRTFRAVGTVPHGPPSSFIGFGNPVLAGPSFLRGKGNGRRIAPASLLATGPTRDSGALADVFKIRELPSLPGTRAELQELGRVIGAPASALYLGADATESRVRSMQLSDVRILAFATHGVTAGEIGGEAEPGLILTPPREPSAADDGYLSASEISTLQLNADWVILSACNTAAGNGSGTPGLSGLARAFFYAGARSLLASHWPVYDVVAPRITADTISRQLANSALTRAQALQQAIQAIRNDPADAALADPAAWAPFSLIGDDQ